MRSWAAALALLAACREETKHEAKSEPPVRVENAVKESDLATIVLTEAAETRLGIKTEPVERKKSDRTRHLGGEALVPPGRTIAVAAPLAGTITPPAPGAIPAPGLVVKRGEPILVLAPFLSPESRATLAASHAEAEGAFVSAGAELEAAIAALRRAERLLSEKAGSQREVDEARARKSIAEAALASSSQRRDVLTRALTGTLDPVSLGSPIDGIVDEVHVAAGQKVGSGAALFEVVDPSKLWIRVPVYVGELDRIARDREVRVGKPGGEAALTAKPVAAPPSADAKAATADLTYEFDNKEGALRPGEKVGVLLPLRDEGEMLHVRSSAVIHDLHGGAWVYVKSGPLRYSRRRVDVRFSDGTLSALERGPEAGTPVVVVGAAELYGTEFFVSK
jgi:RND family efflux transporter MFP subunit